MSIKYIPSDSELIDDLMECYATRFSYAGSKAFIEWIEDCYTDENPFVWDPVAIGCDFSEYGSAEEWADSNWNKPELLEQLGIESDADENEIEDGLTEHLHENHCAIFFDGGVIVSAC